MPRVAQREAMHTSYRPETQDPVIAVTPEGATIYESDMARADGTTAAFVPHFDEGMYEP